MDSCYPPKMDFSVYWQSSLKAQNLRPGQLHVWKADLDKLEYLDFYLSEDEEQRAARLKSPQKRAYFRTARAVLRGLLAVYSGQALQAIRFVYGAKGKPRVQSVPGTRPLEFNLSHSGNLLLAAFSIEAPLGIDLELDQPIEHRDIVVRQYFSVNDRIAYRAMPAEQQKRAFLRAWTCREACGKADGAGFVFGSDLDFFSMQPGDPSAAMSIAFSKFGEFWLLPFSPQSGFTAAVAMKSTVQPQVFFFDLSLGDNLIGFSSSRGLKMQTKAAISGYMKEAVQHKLEIRHG